jgi:DNA-binding MarR family transcriptional regulator
MGSGGLRVRLEIARVLRKPSPHATPQRSEIFPVGQTLILRCLVLILSKSPLGHATDFRLLQLISYNKGRQFIMPNNCEPRVSLPSMCTPAQVAARDGTTPQRVTKWVRKLAANGQIEVERDDRGRIARFSVAQFDRLYERHRDPTKVRTKPRTLHTARTDSDEGAESLAEARRRVTWLDVERRRLELAERKAELVSVESVVAATHTCGAIMVEAIEGLAGCAEDLHVAAHRDGEQGVRILLKKIAHDMRTKIADAFDAIAAEMSNADHGDAHISCDVK